MKYFRTEFQLGASSLAPFYQMETDSGLANQSLLFFQFPGWFMSIYGLYQKFMSAKMQNRVMLIGHDLDLLKTEFPQNQLPEDFGGSVPRSNSSDFVKKIKKEAKRLEKDFAYLSKLCNEGQGSIDRSRSYTVR